ncbi:MAG: CDP-glycerol glycerophosphotransferase family protein [Clostridia bacterium]|nr:CDP-glycerol glycerophosphotransferase family protein [Clostridia bacterium]
MKSLLKKIISPRARRGVLVFLNRVWCFICRCLPLQNRVLFYTIRGDGTLADNARAVYDALDCKKIIFAKKLPHPVKIKPLAYFYLLTSRVIVTDDYVRYMSAVRLRKGQSLIQIWHACGAFKKFGLDAPSSRSEAEEKSLHSQYSAVIVTSEKCRKFYAGAFGVGEDICLPLGLPRTDRLFTDKEKMRENVLDKHPELKNKHIYLYCPTFREAEGERIILDPKINWSELSNTLCDDEIFVIRRHPVMDYRLTDREYPNILDLTDESTLDLTAASDVIITDYSSVIYDACLLSVPSVFYCPDYKDYERGFYLEFPDDLPGELVTEGEKLLEAVRRTKENPPADKIKKFIGEQMEACDGKSAERVGALIEKCLK